MSDSPESGAEPLSSPTPKDVVAYLRGQASPHQTQLVHAALEDPNSPLNDWIKDIEDWPRDAFSRDDRGSRHLIRQDGESDATKNLRAVIDFVRRKHSEKVLSDDDFSRIAMAGGIDTSDVIRTPSEAIATTGRIVAMLTELHPDMADQLARIRLDRQR